MYRFLVGLSGIESSYVSFRWECRTDSVLEVLSNIVSSYAASIGGLLGVPMLLFFTCFEPHLVIF